MSSYYFAYGSNMNQQRMRDRQLKFTEAVAGTLAQSTLLFNKKAADSPHWSYANIGYKADSEVEGVLYQLIDEQEIFKMDPFEGAPRFYSREIFMINTAKGEIPAWTYIANEAMLADNLKPARWYMEHLLAGKSLLSSRYYQKLRQVDCVEVAR